MLGSSHESSAMTVFVIVGLVPLWFVEEHTVDTSSKLITYLISEKGLSKGKPATQRFLDSLSSALKRQYVIAATHKYSENVGCKAFWLMLTKESDEHFFDLVFENQCIFEVAVGEVHMYHLRYRKVMVKASLIDQWAFGKRYWQLPQLVLHFVLTAKLGFCIPPGLGVHGGSRLVLKWAEHFIP
jgi:hypothetical protein